MKPKKQRGWGAAGRVLPSFVLPSSGTRPGSAAVLSFLPGLRPRLTGINQARQEKEDLGKKKTKKNRTLNFLRYPPVNEPVESIFVLP